LLDTPGHKDFSEDTYRTLTAADAAVMLIDAAKGVEPQTRKLFEVCRMRGIPIFTFMNKLDRPSLEPLELLDELEKDLPTTDRKLVAMAIAALMILLPMLKIAERARAVARMPGHGGFPRALRCRMADTEDILGQPSNWASRRCETKSAVEHPHQHQ
jgi:hypothetical protein